MLTVNFNQLAVSRPARLALLAITCRTAYIAAARSAQAFHQ